MYQSIVLMGKVASGKGTQAQALLRTYGGELYSNGNKVRETVGEETIFGNHLRNVYEAGLLIPEWIASYWMAHALLAQYPTDRIIFEGVAKKPDEAALFHEIHEWLGRPYIVFNVIISDDEVRRRSIARERDVLDTHRAIERRLEEYALHTEHSIAYFKGRGKVVDIDGMRDPEAVTKDIMSHLEHPTL